MIGEKVFHSIFGEGIVTEVKDGSKPHQKYITVAFKVGEKKFVFPDIFEKLLKASSDALKDEVQSAFDTIEAEKERERFAKEQERMRVELEKAEAERLLFEKKRAQRTHINTTVISGSLMRGQPYGTAARDIFEAGCDAFAWHEYESKCFGWQTPNYSEVATREGYSVWFLAHSNWTDSDTEDVKNWIFDSYMEQWWTSSDHPASTVRKRLIFAKKDNHYVFLGVFQFVGKEEKRVQNGKIFYVERFDLVTEVYPS